MEEKEGFGSLVRMMLINWVYSTLATFGEQKYRFTKLHRIGFFVLFTLFLIGLNLHNFLQGKDLNYYQALDLPRTASRAELLQAIELAQEDLDAPAYSNRAENQLLDHEKLHLLRKIFSMPLLRESYDNFNIGVTKDEASQKHFSDHGFEKRLGNTFSVIPQYVFFIILIFFVISEHQIFARKMSLMAILTSITIQIMFRMPSEIRGKENVVLVWIDYLIPAAQHLTPHEISQIMFKVFYCLFHFFMNTSRLVDLTPEKMVGQSLQKLNRNAIKTLTCFEKVSFDKLCKEEEVREVKSIKDQQRQIEQEQEEPRNESTEGQLVVAPQKSKEEKLKELDEKMFAIGTKRLSDNDRALKSYTSAINWLIESNLRGLRVMIKKDAENKKKAWFFQRYWRIAVFGLIVYYIAWPVLAQKRKERQEMEEEDKVKKNREDWRFEAAQMAEEEFKRQQDEEQRQREEEEQKHESFPEANFVEKEGEFENVFRDDQESKEEL